MPITSRDLHTGDILFKHASKGAISQAIAKGQMSHYQATMKKVGPSPMGAAATDITHVAIAAGPDDVLEFDEGGASKFQIVFKKGHGFVRGPMTLPSRKGKRYEVFRCLNPALGANAADKAELVWDITHQSKITASYGLKNMLNTAVRHEKGLSASSVEFYESALDAWVKSATGGFFSRPSNIKFFCSEFVAFCYMWAAAESKLGRIFGSEYLLGTDKVRISPVEMYTRIETAARSTFQFKGTLYS